MKQEQTTPEPLQVRVFEAQIFLRKSDEYHFMVVVNDNQLDINQYHHPRWESDPLKMVDDMARKSKRPVDLFVKDEDHISLFDSRVNGVVLGSYYKSYSHLATLNLLFCPPLIVATPNFALLN